MPTPVIHIAYGTRVVMRASQFGSERVNVLHGAHTGLPSTFSDDQVGLLGSLYNAVSTHISLWNASVQWRDLSATATDGSGVQALFPFSPALNGTGAGDPLAGQAAVVYTLRSPLAGRANRGRVFMFGLGEQNAVGNVIDAAYTAVAQAYLVAVKAAFTTNNFEWSIASYTYGRMTAITTFETDTFIRSMRKREQGKGR